MKAWEPDDRSRSTRWRLYSDHVPVLCEIEMG